MNKSIMPCSDMERIRGILSRDNIYSTLVYDGSPSLSQYVPTGLWFILIQDEETITGIINLSPLNNVMWQCHIFIFEQYRGKGSEQWGKQVATWARENVGAKTFLAITPYESAKFYAERVGFKQIGILTESIRKNGKLLHQYLMEMK